MQLMIAATGNHNRSSLLMMYFPHFPAAFGKGSIADFYEKLEKEDAARSTFSIDDSTTTTTSAGHGGSLRGGVLENGLSGKGGEHRVYHLLQLFGAFLYKLQSLPSRFHTKQIIVDRRSRATRRRTGCYLGHHSTVHPVARVPVRRPAKPRTLG